MIAVKKINIIFAATDKDDKQNETKRILHSYTCLSSGSL